MSTVLYGRKLIALRQGHRGPVRRPGRAAIQQPQGAAGLYFCGRRRLFETHWRPLPGQLIVGAGLSTTFDARDLESSARLSSLACFFCRPAPPRALVSSLRAGQPLSPRCRKRLVAGVESEQSNTLRCARRIIDHEVVAPLQFRLPGDCCMQYARTSGAQDCRCHPFVRGRIGRACPCAQTSFLCRLLCRYHYRDTSMLNKLGNNVQSHISQYSPKLVSLLSRLSADWSAHQAQETRSARVLATWLRSCVLP